MKSLKNLSNWIFTLSSLYVLPFLPLHPLHALVGQSSRPPLRLNAILFGEFKENPLNLAIFSRSEPFSTRFTFFSDQTRIARTRDQINSHLFNKTNQKIGVQTSFVSLYFQVS